MKSRVLVLLTLLGLTRATCLAATYMDITGLTPGTADTTPTFTGSLAGVSFVGTLIGTANTALGAVGTGTGSSTILGDSPQWSHGSVYTDATALADRVGFSQAPGGQALMTITFSSPMTDLSFHAANLDYSSFWFGEMAGLNGVGLLSGNSGPGEGFGVSGSLVFDMERITSDGTLPSGAPPLTGARSAYGSVVLSGTYNTVRFYIAPDEGTDYANFTLSSSAVPEPGMSTLAAMGLGAALLRRRRRVVAESPV